MESIGILAEVIASAAVVVSLLYLAIQIRQSTKATRAGTSSYINDALARIMGAIRSDGEFADIWIRGCRSLESLNEIERVRFTCHLLEMIDLAEYVHQIEKQQLSGTHINYIPWVALLYRDNPGIRSFMDSMDSVGSPELQERLTDIEEAKGTNIFITKSVEDG